MDGAWRLLRDPPASACWNMSVDEALLARIGEGPPVLRLYRFERPAATLGYRQGVPAWRARAAACGMELVRRPSGGGTVIHAGDLTLAVVVPRRWPEFPARARESFAWVRDTVMSALAALGLRVDAAQPQVHAARAELCFAGSTGAEIELGGCKLMGSAQRRTRSGWLQQGSIRLADDSAWYARALDLRAPAFAHGLPQLAPQCVADAIVAAFELRLGRALTACALRPDERAEALERQARRQGTPLSAPGLPMKSGALR